MATVQELEQLKASGFSQGIQDLLDTAIQRQNIKSGVASQELVANALQQISKILAQAQVTTSGGTGTVDEQEVVRIVKQELNDAQIGISNLDKTVTDLLKGQTVQATLTFVEGVNTTTAQVTIDLDFINRPLSQLILSDVAAKNNVYLYGGAGTGKTYTASEMARALGWALVEVNCNQFTSPLELMGGQTITGYQEGSVVQAWSNKINGQQVNGCVLLLDELPKLDPNTAGLLNSALAKVKLDSSRNKITNGRGEKFEKGNLLIIGTGNTRLNETSEDYEANFKQDLSLQDRFVGSTYEIFVYWETEVTQTMKGYLFIWLYMIKVRNFVEENKQTGRAFVSIRLMENLRDTYTVYRTYESQLSGLITKPKTLEAACESFFSLFPANVQEKMKNETDFDGFKNIIAQKNTIPLDTTSMRQDFDTAQESKDAYDMAVQHDKDKNKIYNT